MSYFSLTEWCMDHVLIALGTLLGGGLKWKVSVRH